MEECVFLKLSGQLFTTPGSSLKVQRESLQRLAREISKVYHAHPTLRLVIGHSCGFFHASQKPIDRSRDQGDRAGAHALAAASAARMALNTLVRAVLLDLGVPAITLPPSAIGFLHHPDVLISAWTPLDYILSWEAVPLIYSDMIVGRNSSQPTSVEYIFQMLVDIVPPTRIILVEPFPTATSQWRPSNGNGTTRHILPAQTWLALNGPQTSEHCDYADIASLVHALPDIPVHMVDGTIPGLLESCLGSKAPQLSFPTQLQSS